MLFPLFFIFVFKCVLTCPSFLSQKCFCEEVNNGVVIDCSNNTGYEMMELIRKNQVLLGLIQSLTLKNASLENLSVGLFHGLYIKKLDLSHNSIEVIHDNAFHGMNPVLEELIISYNNLRQIPSKSIAVFPRLLSLDISNNWIQEIKENTSFPSLNMLRDLNLGSNYIVSIHTNAFHNIKNSIKTINLGHNKMILVPSSAIRGLKQLQSLHLHKNKIKDLDALSFLNLPVLNLLNLAGNKIEELNRQAFLNVPNLRYLYLSNNRITKLAEYQFQTFDNLEMLDLTNNTIAKIPGQCLSGLKQLRQLYLGNNNISAISNFAFVNSSISLLVLSDNNLQMIEDGTLNGLSNLQQVTFRNNKIHSISQHAFFDVPSIVMLDLANNNLSHLYQSTFLAQANMLFADLSENKFTKTPYSAFNQKKGTILLKENPSVCLEKIHMIKEGTGVTIENSKDNYCLNLTDVPLFSVQQKQSQKMTEIPKLIIRRNKQEYSNNTSQNKLTLHEAVQTDELGKTQIHNINAHKKKEVTADSLEHIGAESLPFRKINKINETILPSSIPFHKTDVFPLKRTFVPISRQAVPTLPPTIVVLPGSSESISRKIFNNDSRIEKAEYIVSESENAEVLLAKKFRNSFSTVSIMILSVGISILTLIIVVIGLCVSKNRQLQNETVANMHEALPSHHNLSEFRPTNNGIKKTHYGQAPTWIYNPGSSYCNYYK